MSSILLNKIYQDSVKHKSNDLIVDFSDSEIYILIYLSFKYIGWEVDQFELHDVVLPSEDYYEIPLEFFESVFVPEVDKKLIISLLASGIERDLDFQMFFDSFRLLHQKRSKYKRILSKQALPSIDQVGPRVLLEYGETNLELIGNWLLWRKWIYDIDNRSAQETGYVFEPVLASSLRGVSCSASKSPVKRVGANGQVSDKGRQVDCLDEELKLAYEFKLRVTIAASGQGRFKEELSFPKEARVAGYQPILLVLDETPSNRLDELSKAFQDEGGLVYLGEAVWDLIGSKAGNVMSTYISNLVRPAIDSLEELDLRELESVSLSWSKDLVTISSGGNDYKIRRDDGK